MEKVLRLEQEYNFVKGQAAEGSDLFDYFECTVGLLILVERVDCHFNRFNASLLALTKGDARHNDMFVSSLVAMRESSVAAAQLVEGLLGDRRMKKVFEKLTNIIVKYMKGITELLRGKRIRNFGSRYQKPLDDAVRDVLKVGATLTQLKSEVKLEILQ